MGVGNAVLAAPQTRERRTDRGKATILSALLASTPILRRAFGSDTLTAPPKGSSGAPLRWRSRG